MRGPQRIGPYQVEARLGQGGMGVVYRAHDPELGRGLAVKVLAAQALIDDRARARFQREAEALAQVPHPHVVRVHAAGEDDGQPWIALDLIEGESLGDRIRRGPLEPRAAARIAAELAGALAHVHEAGILHRDLKPDNVLLDANDRALLTDFGLARQLDPALTRLSATGTAAGTPGYMSPEQVRGEREADSKVDVYGLGCVLYAMLAGRPPFVGTPFELGLATLEAPPQPPSVHRREIPRALDAICLRCLAKEPDARPTATELATELERFLAGTWRPPTLAWALPAAGALAVVAVGVGLALTQPAPPSPAPSPSAHVATTSPAPRLFATPKPTPTTPTVDPAETLAALRRRVDAEVLPELDAWLTAHPGHALADDARALRRRVLARPLWTGRLSAPLRQRGTEDTCLLWWGDDRLLAWMRFGAGIEVWSTRERRATQAIMLPGPVLSVLRLDARRLLVGLGDGRLCWVQDGVVERTIDAFVAADDTSQRNWGVDIDDLALTADGTGVWAASHAGLIRAFSLESGELQRELRHGEPVRRLLPVDSDRLISAAGLSVSIRDRSQDDPSATNSLRVWDLTTGEPIDFTPLGWGPQGLARTGTRILLSNANNEIRLFAFNGRQLEHDRYLAGAGLASDPDGFLHGQSALSSGLQDMTLVDGRVYAVGGTEAGGELRAWRLPSGAQTLHWTLPRHGTGVAVQAGQLALALADGHLQLHREPEAP